MEARAGNFDRFYPDFHFILTYFFDLKKKIFFPKYFQFISSLRQKNLGKSQDIFLSQLTLDFSVLKFLLQKYKKNSEKNDWVYVKVAFAQLMTKSYIKTIPSTFPSLLHSHLFYLPIPLPSHPFYLPIPSTFPSLPPSHSFYLPISSTFQFLPPSNPFHLSDIRPPDIRLIILPDRIRIQGSRAYRGRLTPKV